MNKLTDTMLIFYAVNRAYLGRKISKFTIFNEFTKMRQATFFFL